MLSAVLKHFADDLVVVGLFFEPSEVHIIADLSSDLLLGEYRRESLFADTGKIGRAGFAMSEAKNTTLFGVSRTFTPADVVGASLTIATWVIAQESFLLFSLGTDHGMSVLSGESLLGALSAKI